MININYNQIVNRITHLIDRDMKDIGRAVMCNDAYSNSRITKKRTSISKKVKALKALEAEPKRDKYLMQDIAREFKFRQ